MPTMEDYWKEATSLHGNAFRQKQILQEIIDEHLTYDKVHSWAEQKTDFGPVDTSNVGNNDPLVRYMQEATGEKTWWIQQERHDDPHLVIGVADTGVVHMNNDPNQGELPDWAQVCMAHLMRLPYDEWLDRQKFLAILDMAEIRNLSERADE